MHLLAALRPASCRIDPPSVITEHELRIGGTMAQHADEFRFDVDPRFRPLLWLWGARKTARVEVGIRRSAFASRGSTTD